MEILLAGLLAALLTVSIAAVVRTVHSDGRGHLPPVHSGRPWHGNALWDIQDPQGMSRDGVHRQRMH